MENLAAHSLPVTPLLPVVPEEDPEPLPWPPLQLCPRHAPPSRFRPARTASLPPRGLAGPRWSRGWGSSACLACSCFISRRSGVSSGVRSSERPPLTTLPYYTGMFLCCLQHTYRCLNLLGTFIFYPPYIGSPRRSETLSYLGAQSDAWHPAGAQWASAGCLAPSQTKWVDVRAQWRALWHRRPWGSCAVPG